MNEQQLIDRLERLAAAEEHPDWDEIAGVPYRRPSRDVPDRGAGVS